MEITSDEGPFHVRPRGHYNRWRRLRRRRIVNAAARKTRGQKLISPPPCHAVLKYVVPSLLSLVTLKFQTTAESLFGENPAPIWCFIGATCIYWLIAEKMKHMPAPDVRRIQIFSCTARASGVLSVWSLVSVFLPRRISLGILAMGSLAAVVLAWPLLGCAYGWAITSVVDKIHAIVVRARGCNLTEEACSPV